MVHLVIKELANSAEDIIMVTSTIMKDTGGGSDAIYRPNAIRALCRIIDVGELSQGAPLWGFRRCGGVLTGTARQRLFNRLSE